VAKDMLIAAPEPRTADEPAPAYPNNGRLMLITPSRLAYRGLFGSPGERRLGAWTFYVALQSPFEVSVDGSPAERHTFALVPPYTAHRVTTQDLEMAMVLVEAESVDGPAMKEQLLASAAQRELCAAAIRNGFARPMSRCEDFDLRFFGQRLPSRTLDARVQRAIDRMCSQPAARLSAEDCAALTGLSFSRFTHLFSEQTGTTFRRFRAWKRARGLMRMVGHNLNLLDVALSAGYADSTHFSHSIRQFYGLTPRDIFAFSRQLSVISQQA
jgi:AraC-like DNA-binding protein